MKKITSLCWAFLALSFLSFIPSNIYGSHAMGVDLSYECLGGNQYRFRLVFYRDCAGVTMGTTASLTLSSLTCTNATVSLSQVGTPTEVSPLCPAQLGNSTCNSGTLPGVEQYVYEGTYTFTQNCNDWIVGYTHCCRNAMITNLVTPSSQSLYVEAELNNTLAGCNSSPQFTSLPVPYICVGQQFCYNHGAVDPDGDSLVYTLVNAMTTGGTPIGYNTPTSPTYPMTTASGIVNFDPATGSMCVTPNVVQVAVVSVRVDEYRNGIRIGSTMRDLQIVVQSCSNAQPQMTSGGLTNLTGSGAIIDSNTVELCPGSTVTYDVVFNDANAGDVITITNNLSTSIPGATFTTTGTNPVTATFSWTPTALDIGYHAYTITVQDNGCPILGSQVFAFDVRVLDGTYAGPDLNYCPAGGPLQITAAGGSVFTWTTLSGDAGGLSCTNCANPLASPSVTSTYEVTSNLSSTCKNKDTVVVNRVPDFSLSPGADQTICKYGVANLAANASPGTYAPYNFSWTPSTSLSNPNIANPVANPLVTTTYVLTTTSAAGCTIRDSMQVIISGEAPQVTIAPLDTLCTGVPATVVTTVAFDCDTTSVPCSGPGSSGVVGNGTSATSTYGPHYMFTTSPYSVRLQYIFTKAELEAMGFVGGGRINNIALYYTTANSTADDISISMGCTTQDQWSTSPYSFITGLTEVKTNFSHTPSVGWNNFNFDYPYNWDGQSNLVVQICTADTNIGTSSSVQYGCLSPVAYRTLYYLLYNTAGACSNPTGTRTSCRPNMRFNWCPALPASLTYSWTPTTGVSNPNIPNPTISATTTTTYTFSASDGSCTGSDFATVEVAPPFSLNAGPDTTLCKNVPMLFNPSVGGSYSPYRFTWTPGSSLDCDSCATPTAMPDSSTTYVLAVRSSLGCTMYDTVAVNLSGEAPLVTMGSGDTICPVGDNALLNPSIAYSCGIATHPCSGPANTGQIGFGSSATTTYGPHYMFTTSPYSIRRQFIFTKDELDAMGFAGGGRINAIDLQYSTAYSTADDISISMGCTNKDQWDVAPYEFETGLTTVKGLFSHTPTVGWNSFTLDNPYMWDGQSNLVVEFCTADTNLGTGSSVYYDCLSPVAYRTLYYSMYNGDSACGYPTGTRTSCRPNMQFHYCEALPGTLNYNWTPSSGLSATNVQSPTATPSATTTYTFTVDDGSGCSGLGFVTVAIDSTGFVVGSASDPTPCVGDPVNLNALVTGSPAPPVLSACGTNGTALSMPPSTVSVAGGTGTSNTTTYSPFYGTYSDHKVQYLFQASELMAAGLVSGTITEISFNVTSQLSSGQFRGFTLSMGCTNATTLNISAWEPTTVVWGGNNYNVNLGMNTFTLAQPFDWDGTSNLVVEACFNGNTSIGSDQVQYVFGLPFNGTMRNGISGGGNDGCTLTPSWVYTARPVIDFTVVPPPPNSFSYSWSPSTGLTNPNVPNPTLSSFAGGTQTLTVTVTGGTCTIQDTVNLLECGALSADRLELFGETEGDVGLLEWITVNENATAQFELERGSDESQYQRIHSQPARGHTQGETRYVFRDLDPIPGRSMYRVKMTNLDGSIRYSNPVELWFDHLSGLVKVYPNPVNAGQALIAEFESAEGGNLDIIMTDMLGRVVLKTREVLVQGQNLVNIPVGDISRGTYFLEMAHEGRNHSVKLVVLD